MQLVNIEMELFDDVNENVRISEDDEEEEDEIIKKDFIEEVLQYKISLMKLICFDCKIEFRFLRKVNFEECFEEMVINMQRLESRVEVLIFFLERIGNSNVLLGGFKEEMKGNFFVMFV